MKQSLAFGKWIEDQIEARGWSFRELGRRANLSSGGISKVVNGQVQPTSQFCRSVATALKEPPELVFRQAGLLPPSADYDEIGEQGQQLLEYLRRLSSEHREVVLLLARTLYQHQP